MVIIPCCLMLASLGLSMALLPRIGIVGAAWGLVVPMFLAAFVYLHIGARTCGIHVRDLLSTSFDGLFLPVVAFLGMGFSINSLTGPGWTSVVAALLGGGLGYLITFLLTGAREDELRLVRKLVEVPRAAGYQSYRRLRRLLARVGFLRSGYYLLLSIREAVMDSPARGQAELNHEFEPREDPWDYATVSYQGDRIRSELAALDSVRGTARFGKALEVGCAEGAFTEMLAPRCESLLAVDISSIALARARRRLRTEERVRFAEWDLRVDPIPDTYDLIVMIHALEYIRNPLYVRRARSKLVNSLLPGGYFLVGTMKVAEIYEDAWWGRYLLRSGKRINDLFSGHPALKVIWNAEFYLGKDFVSYDVLLQKKG
jgi:2-polyprenyl-3-methyl-5-hydroxy-6-metoxy-1,4-benzoquinol methylase